MPDPFAAMVEGLFASNMAETVDYDYRDETITPGIPALVGPHDVVGETGERMEVAHDVRRFEIRAGDILKDPARGHRIIRCDQTTYEVQSPPHKDRLGLVWIIDAYLI